MDAVREPTLRPRNRRRFASTIVATLALIQIAALAACGAPARIQTLDREPDLVRVAGRTIPPGFGDSVNAELHRLVAACAAIDRNVSRLPGISVPGDAVTQWALVDGHCEWPGDPDRPGGPGGPGPDLIVGILASPGGGGVLDQTASILRGERSIAGVGDRAVYDPRTRTLYALAHGRLWYLQLVGSSPRADGPGILATLGRALVKTSAAR
jgi:hypothetical protein